MIQCCKVQEKLPCQRLAFYFIVLIHVLICLFFAFINYVFLPLFSKTKSMTQQCVRDLPTQGLALRAGSALRTHSEERFIAQ